MSTRCTINFCNEDDIVAKVYRHCDGYPNGQYGVKHDLKNFFGDVLNECKNDPRFNDPSYLAAKFVVWQANEYKRENKLDFLFVGICQDDPRDIEFTYFINCNNYDNTFPKVRCKKV